MHLPASEFMVYEKKAPWDASKKKLLFQMLVENKRKTYVG